MSWPEGPYPSYESSNSGQELVFRRLKRFANHITTAGRTLALSAGGE